MKTSRIIYTGYAKLVSMLLLLVLYAAFTSVAFANTIALPDALLTIEEEAFYGDTSIKNIVLPEGVRSIGARAFANSSLSDKYLPLSINYIGENAFKNTSVVGRGL